MPSAAEIGQIKKDRHNMMAEERHSSNIALKKGDYCPEIFFIG